MAKIKEQLTIAAYVGQPIEKDTMESLAECAKNGSGSYADCTEYSVNLQNLARNPETFEILGITAKQAKEWTHDCTSFLLRVYVKDDFLAGAHISKRLCTELLPNGYETDPSNGDLQVIRRILKAVTEPVAHFPAG